ncbi:MAG: GNAT family N-acetyltransferase [Zoogloeaceae bacterium]|nr:GNAT family N-acetyltransferase [Rhodocyclaceae bacterium]MCP5234481.1 GNAT family N-acetyltransferase [Zoogloeaceae bacterium]
MSHIEPVIRSARDTDADAIAKLHAESWRSTARGLMSDHYLDEEVHAERRSLWRARLGSGESQYLTLVAVQRDGLHGFICFKLRADSRWGTLLDNLHVDPELCGRGLGEALMKVGVAQVEQATPGQPMHLLVFAANLGARRFYRRLGGIESGEVELALPEGDRSAQAIRIAWPAPVLLQAA